MKTYVNLLILLSDFVLIFSSADLEISTQLSNATDSFLPEYRCEVGGGPGFVGGDNYDIFYDHDKNGKVEAYIAVSKEQDNQMPCYIRIERYNTSRQNYDFDDKVFLTKNLKSSNRSEASEKRKWRAFHDTKDNYKIESTSGMLLSLFNI